MKKQVSLTWKWIGSSQNAVQTHKQHVSCLAIIIIIRYYCNDKHVEQISVFKWLSSPMFTTNNTTYECRYLLSFNKHIVILVVFLLKKMETEFLLCFFVYNANPDKILDIVVNKRVWWWYILLSLKMTWKLSVHTCVQPCPNSNIKTKNHYCFYRASVRYSSIVI